jgi:hypothetical protein
VALSRVGAVDAAAGLALSRAFDQLIRVDSSDAGVYVELEAGSADARIALRCRPEAGLARLPRAKLAELPVGAGVLTAVRVVSAELRATAGPRQGELWVEYRDELAIGIR